jgi:hypothetical protein
LSSSSTGYYFIDFFKNCFLVIESKDLFDSNYTGFGIILSVELDWIMFDRLRPNCKLFLFEDLLKNSMIIAGQIYPSPLYLVKLFLGPVCLLKINFFFKVNFRKVNYFPMFGSVMETKLENTFQCLVMSWKMSWKVTY